MSQETQESNARTVTLIQTTLTIRGGTEEIPARLIEQFWSLDGKLVAENDPLKPSHAACCGVAEILKARGFQPKTSSVLSLPEAVATALDDLQNIIDKQKELIAKLQEKVHTECQEEEKSEAPKKTTT